MPEKKFRREFTTVYDPISNGHVERKLDLVAKRSIAAFLAFQSYFDGV